jgi:hypothetical protein
VVDGLRIEWLSPIASNWRSKSFLIVSKFSNKSDPDRGHLNLESAKYRVLNNLLILFVLGLSLSLSGCGSSGTPPGAVVGRAGIYDYSPSVIQSGDVEQFWWCGQAHNPINPSQDTDGILYESINTSTHVSSTPVVVLAETPGAWDSAYTCNPKVVRGSFVNPLGNGQTYSYVMYYVGTTSGADNSIGAAFSSDGIHWDKYPQPIIQPAIANSYGVGQPIVYNSDQKSGIVMFYENSTSTIIHIEATSTDGIHFTVQGTLTTNGLDLASQQASWGDMAYDSANKSWYAAFNLPLRDPATTGYINATTTPFSLERGQYGVQLYRIAGGSILNGATPWQLLKTIDTNSTGYECNFIAGILRDEYGTVNVGAYPAIQMYPSISNSHPNWDATPNEAGTSCLIKNWDVGFASWSPSDGPLALNVYFNNKVHEVTTGWIDPNGGFILQSTIGHLYESPQNGATVPFYGCKSGSVDYFISLDSSCEGARILGLNGYGYSQPLAGASLIPLYRCYTGQDHFVSRDSSCNGATVEELLGYSLP